MTALDGPRAAWATTFDAPPGWDIELDTHLSYSLGLRAQPRNDLISNSPIQQNDEFKFPNFGSLDSNRIDVAPEFSVAYEKNTGFDVSMEAWKDFAYNGGNATNPELYAPGVPFSALSSAPDGHYGAYTHYLYNLGAQLDNAYVFENFAVAQVPVSMKVGRFTEYWGNALFAGGQAISYGQSPVDGIKAVDSPGTEVKDLFLPRGQFSLDATVVPQLTLGFQYQFEWRGERLPEGGTFLGVADPFFVGPETIEGAIVRSDNDHTPTNLDGNFGLEALWSPNFLQNGSIGFYYRQFDDIAPYGVYALDVTTPAPVYHLAYARHVHMYAVSLDNNIGPVSTSFEVSARANTGLFMVPGGIPSLDPTGYDGPRGNLLNVLGNAEYILPRGRLWDTGVLVGEIAFTHLLAVTHDPQLYDAVGYACSAHGIDPQYGSRDGCATENEANLNLVFDPTWLQVFPAVDLDAPISVNVGLSGSGQTFVTEGDGTVAGSVAYNAGIHALIKQKYNIKLDYTGFHSTFGKTALTPSGLPYYVTGMGNYMWNDKSQIQLTFSLNF